jgi:hypothetical protein
MAKREVERETGKKGGNAGGQKVKFKGQGFLSVGGRLATTNAKRT